MIISVYNAKGGVGKTPISANIAFDKEYLVATNEVFHIYDKIIEDGSLLVEEGSLLVVDPEEEFTSEIKNNGLNVVFDLAGSLSSSSLSISSALLMSDVVIVPINNEWKAINAGLNTIKQVLEYNSNIIVVATKLTKQSKDFFTKDWKESGDYINIKNQVCEHFGDKITVLPLKNSKVFDNIFEQRKSIKQFCTDSPLKAHSYKIVEEQFDDIYKKLGV